MRHALRRLRAVLLLQASKNSGLLLPFCALYFVTFFVLLPWRCRYWPHSFYMTSSLSQDDAIRMVTERNDRRLRAAEAHLSELDGGSTLAEYGRQSDVDVAVGVVTVPRNFQQHAPSYLTQVVARLDAALKSDGSFPGKALFMCNAHAGPGAHEEALRLARYFPIATRFPNGSTSHTILDQYEKEKQDYAFCLQQAMCRHPKYVLLLEDDALPQLDVFAALRYILDYRVEGRWRSGALLDNRDRWAYVKLFHPEKWQGYAAELRSFCELIALGALGGCASLLALHRCSRAGRSRRRHPGSALGLSFALGACYAILCALLIGRQNVLEIRRLSYAWYTVWDAPSCCTPAVLYPSHVVPSLISHLHNTTCSRHFPVDLAIDKFAASRGLQRYIIEPNLFKHIGYVSTLKGPSRKPVQFI